MNLFFPEFFLSSSWKDLPYVLCIVQTYVLCIVQRIRTRLSPVYFTEFTHSQGCLFYGDLSEGEV
jgi:hypothetical protein